MTNELNKSLESDGKQQEKSTDSNSTPATGGPQSDQDELVDVRSAVADDNDTVKREDEDEQEFHERVNKERHRRQIKLNNNHDNSKQHHHHHHHHNHHHHHHHHRCNHPNHRHEYDSKGHIKELIKTDSMSRARSKSPADHNRGQKQPPRAEVATVVDEGQLHQRLLESISEKAKPNVVDQQHQKAPDAETRGRHQAVSPKTNRSSSNSSSSSLHSNHHHRHHNSNHSQSNSNSSSPRGKNSDADRSLRSPPPAAIIIPPNVAESLSSRSRQPAARSSIDSLGSITREQLEYGPLLKSDRPLRHEQAKQVAPNMRQSPIAIMSLNPAYELINKPLTIEYPSIVDNLRLNNTGFSWEVKIPYQISMNTALYGAHLSSTQRYRLDQFHCHWGEDDDHGSEHTVDNRSYSAEMHFVHYNMEKYHTLSKAARHIDGLVVLSVFVDAHEDHHNHAELEKVVAHLKSIPLYGEHTIIKHPIRIENLLPANRSYWSYQGSLTTPPYFESVTWFVLKHPIKCNKSQIQKFRGLKSALKQDDDDDSKFIRSNHRKTQPLNGRTIVNYDEYLGSNPRSY